MEVLYAILLAAGLYLIIRLKRSLWDHPHEEIAQLRRDAACAKSNYQTELNALKDEYERSIAATEIVLEKQYQERTCSVQSACEERIEAIENDNARLRKECEELHTALKTFESNLTAIPYMAGMIADIETYGLEKLALGLSWGTAQKRLDKVKSIREIRKDARAMVEKNKDAQYQLAYLLELFPNLSDVIECEFTQLPAIEVSEVSAYNGARDYLSKDEYLSLTVTARNQLALDRYVNSHNKTKWQIGRDYEQYVGYQYRKKGYEVDDYGSYMGLEDLGRDIIAKKDDTVLIIQCKYWSSLKQIHEKHVMQLYGTLVSYCIENGIEQSLVNGILVTNI